MCNCDDDLVISDVIAHASMIGSSKNVFERTTIYDTSQCFHDDYFNQTIPVAEEMATLARTQITRLSTNDDFKSNTLYADVHVSSIHNGPVKIYDKLSIESLNTCGLKRKTDYPEFQNLINQYDVFFLHRRTETGQ